MGRYFISKGYAAAAGDPMARYSHPWARNMWKGMLMVFGLGAASSVRLIVKGDMTVL